MSTPKTGGWPRGERRHAELPEWAATLSALHDLLGCHHRRGLISLGALASSVGVSGARTAARWLSGLQLPDPPTQRRIAAWVLAHEVRIRRERGAAT